MEKLPPECYLSKTGEQQILAESNERYILDRLEIADGIFIYIKGAMHPYKNFPTAEGVFAINMVKAFAIETLKAFGKWYYLPTLYWNRTKLVDSFNRISWKIMSPHLLKFQYTSKFARALHWIIFSFMMEIGIKEKPADDFATIFVQVIDFDNAYRLRMVDLFSETSKELFVKHPRKEIKRLIKISRERDHIGVSNKFKMFAWVISCLVLIPRVKKSLVKIIKDSDFEDLQYDASDKYWVCMRSDYKFLGLDHKGRQDYAKSMGWVYPSPEI